MMPRVPNLDSIENKKEVGPMIPQQFGGPSGMRYSVMFRNAGKSSGITSAGVEPRL